MFGKFDLRRIGFLSRNAAATAAAIAFIGASSGGLAQTQAPSGTVNLQLVQASFVGTASNGKGVLHFQGHDYPFTTKGGGIGGFGLSKFEAAGEVYNLKSLADFDGPYAQLRAGVALGEQGKGKMALENLHGVSMALSGRRRGLAVSLGADALVVSLGR